MGIPKLSGNYQQSDDNSLGNCELTVNSLLVLLVEIIKIVHFLQHLEGEGENVRV